MKKILQSNKLNFLFACIFYLGISIWFFGDSYWHELIVDSSQAGMNVGEVQASEWGMEQIYQNIIHWKNPFSPISNILYPFGLDIVASDPGVAFYFVLLRPFFSPHQSLSFVLIFGVIAANLGMYSVLKSLKIPSPISLLIGMAYGYMTFIQPRAGHPGYIASIFVFPWIFFFVIKFFHSNTPKQKILSCLGFSLLVSWNLWVSSYYFIVTLIAVGVTMLWFFLYRRKLLWQIIQNNFFYFIFCAAIIILIQLPWISTVYRTSLFSENPSPTGWAGAIEFSSDLFGFFVPSIHNHYYGQTVAKIIQNVPFARNIFENFTYPGIIILGTVGFIILKNKQIDRSLFNKIFPYIFISFCFSILTLGPFLHIFGKWTILTEENISLVFPLPFVFLHYLPSIGNIRAPGRLIVGSIFFMDIAAAYVLTWVYRNLTPIKKRYFLLFIFSIILFDNRPKSIVNRTPVFIPKKIYATIKQDPNPVSVLEIPFGVRDGFTWFGDYSATNMTFSQSFHQKPFIGGYAGRIPNYVKNYYLRNPLTRYIGLSQDKDLHQNPYMLSLGIESQGELDVSLSKEALDFLNIKYVVVHDQKMNQMISTKEKFAERALLNLGFKQEMTDGPYKLLIREPNEREFLDANFVSPESMILLGLGWENLEGEYRWSNKHSSVMFKVLTPRKMKLHFSASAFQETQGLQIYINKEKAGKLSVSPGWNEYELTLPELDSGINTVYFLFDKQFRPSDFDSGSQDMRSLSAMMKDIYLTENDN